MLRVWVRGKSPSKTRRVPLNGRSIYQKMKFSIYEAKKKVTIIMTNGWVVAAHDYQNDKICDDSAKKRNIGSQILHLSDQHIIFDGR